MSWAVGHDPKWKRDVGYGVPATCDQPDCGGEIDRGLSYVCGGEPYGGDAGCGLHFCMAHLDYGKGDVQQCIRCVRGEEPFEPTPDTPRWLEHKLTDPSWEPWREANREQVEAARLALAS